MHVNYHVPHSAVYLLVGIVLWNFFNEMTVQSLGSIVGRGDLIRKIRIPRWIIVFSTSLSASINLLLNLLVVGVFMAINKVGLQSSALLIPLILIEVYVFALGISLFLSALYVKFRDVSYIWEVLMQAGFYLTPIIYPLTRLSNITLKKLVLINPMGQAIQDGRYALITHRAPTVHQVFNGGWHDLIPFAIVVVVLIVGVIYFKSQANSFAENI
jgi:ABC-2 type transport system permease protein